MDRVSQKICATLWNSQGACEDMFSKTISCLGGRVSKDCAPYDGISTVLLRQGSSQHTMSKRSE